MRRKKEKEGKGDHETEINYKRIMNAGNINVNNILTKSEIIHHFVQDDEE